MVKNDQWLPYSSELADELKRDPRTNRGSFGEALAELQELLAKLGAESPGESSRTPAKSSAPAPRSLGQISSKKLFEDEIFNEKAFKEKIFIQEGFYRCRNCPGFKDKLVMRAKRHARSCGERPKQPRTRNRVPRHLCSAENCDKKFSLISELNMHYRVEHAQRRLYRCPPCRTTFVSWSNLTRHRAEKHGGEVEKYGCGICEYNSTRAGNVKRHQESKHAENRVGMGEEELDLDLEVDVGLDGVVEEDDDGEGDPCDQEDLYEDLPEVRRVQFQINEMWPRRGEMGNYELRK